MSALIGIYMIRNKSINKVYIGSSIDIERRIRTHKSKLNNNSHDNTYLQRDWNIYGEENFEFRIIEESCKETDLPFLERKYIDQHEEVYNWSDPIEESVKGRFKKPIIHKINKKKNEKGLIVINKLKEHFSDKIQILHEHIEERKFFPKQALDDWFLKNIDDPEILNIKSKILEAILNTWYCDSGFSILNSRIWISTFKRLFNKNIGEYEFIIVLPETAKHLYEYKYKKNNTYITQ